MKIQPAVKKETAYIAAGTGIGTLLMFIGFWLLHMAAPEYVPLDYKVFLTGILGAAVAVGNFFMMGLTVQRVTSAENDQQAYNAMKASYRYRTLGQLLWVVLALVVPCFNGAAGIIPLFIPNICIKLREILGLTS